MWRSPRPRGLGLARDLRLRQPGDVDNQGWLLGDYRNSVRYVLNSTHADAAIEYDSFGQVLGGTTPADAHSLVGYIGQVFDVETGLGYFNARYYDPATGRFLSEDPIGFAGGDTNLYRYVGNDPINRIDPSGLSWLSKAIDVVVEFGKDVDDFINENGGWAAWGVAALLIPTLSIGAFSVGAGVFGGELGLGVTLDVGALLAGSSSGFSLSGGLLGSALTAGAELTVASIGAAIHGPYGNSPSDNEQFEPPVEAYQAYIPPIVYPIPQAGGAWSDYMSDVDIRPYTTIQIDIPATFGIPPVPTNQPGPAQVKRQDQSTGVAQYLTDSVEQVLLGDFSDKSTALGTVVQVATSFTGLDVAADIRDFGASISDLASGIQQGNVSWRHFAKLGLNSIGFLPVLGVVKHLDKLTPALKNADEAAKSTDALQRAAARHSTPSPALPGSPYHPDVVDARVRPTYQANPARDPRNPNFKPYKTPEPPDAASVYRRAIRGHWRTWYGLGRDGQVYRFFGDNVGGAHFSGIVNPRDVPKDVRTLLGL